MQRNGWWLRHVSAPLSCQNSVTFGVVARSGLGAPNAGFSALERRRE